ncbi:MAG: ribosome maturation factor RimM [Acidobacteriota bacterium]
MSPQDARNEGGDWLIVGRVGKPHGIHGDLLVEIITDFPERLQAGVRFGVGDETAPADFFEVHRIRYHKGQWLLSVGGLRDRDDAATWRGRFLFLPEQALEELPEGFVYEHHLVGLECRAPDGSSLGHVTGVEAGGEQSRIVVRRGSREFLVPFVPQIVREVDLEQGTVIVDAPAGLLDDDFDTA